MLFFRRRKAPRYPDGRRLPIVRRKLPMRYHMKHKFGVSDVAFLQTMHALTGAPLANGNSVEILRNGVQFFPAMLAAIRGARKTINLEFYIYWMVKWAEPFAEALAERARAGVQVKVHPRCRRVGHDVGDAHRVHGAQWHRPGVVSPAALVHALALQPPHAPEVC